MTNKPKAIKFTIFAVATLLLSALWFRWADAAPTHADCVAYRTRRTAAWDNVPSPRRIINADLYCGNMS